MPGLRFQNQCLYSGSTHSNHLSSCWPALVHWFCSVFLSNFSPDTYEWHTYPKLHALCSSHFHRASGPWIAQYCLVCITLALDFFENHMLFLNLSHFSLILNVVIPGYTLLMFWCSARAYFSFLMRIVDGQVSHQHSVHCSLQEVIVKTQSRQIWILPHPHHIRCFQMFCPAQSALFPLQTDCYSQDHAVWYDSLCNWIGIRTYCL